MRNELRARRTRLASHDWRMCSRPDRARPFEEDDT